MMSDSTIVTLKSVEKIEKNGKTYFKLQDQNDKNWYIFNTKINPEKNKAYRLVHEKSEDGRFDNVKSIDPIEATPGTIPGPIPPSMAEQLNKSLSSNGNREDSIEAQVSAKIVSDLFIAGKIPENHNLTQLLYSYLDKRLTKATK